MQNRDKLEIFIDPGERLTSESKAVCALLLKEYYKIVNGSPPSKGILPHLCRFFLQKCISTQETKQSSKFQSDRRLK